MASGAANFLLQPFYFFLDSMQVWIGTSGYSYPDWVGPYYPRGTKSGRMLGHYATQFPVVELNFTFYRLPTAKQLVRLAEQTPPGFQFLVKLPRTLSHERKTEDLASFHQAVAALQECGRLLGLLCQLPQSFHFGRGSKTWIGYLATELAGLSLAIEFRHISWFREDVPTWLAEHRLDLVSVDVPDLKGLYPRGLVRSGPRIYVRFHSRNAANWYHADKDRYDYLYSDTEMNEWLDSLAAVAPATERALLLFNNCHRAQAVENARRMKELVGRIAPTLTGVSPFVGESPQGQQRSLFD